MDPLSPVAVKEISGQAKEIKSPDLAAQEKDRLSAKKVARDFESIFIGLMMKSMRETVGKDSLTGGGHGEEMYRSMLDQEYAKAASEAQTLGLATAIEKELLKTLPGGVNNANSLSPDGTMRALKQQSDGIQYQPKNMEYYK
jgi:flagellar protein FlgJ